MKDSLRTLDSLWKRGLRSTMVAGVLGTAIRAGANFLLLPLVLIKLSASELAVWWVFVALGNFGNLADFGFGSTIPRIYSYFLAGAEDFEAEGIAMAKTGGQPNYLGISRLNVTVRSLYLKISLIAIALLATGGALLLIKPAAESGLSHKVWLLWIFFVMAIGYNLATSHWVLAIQGINRMRDLQLTYVLGGLSFVGCAAVLLLCKMGLASMVIATFVKGFVTHGRCCQIYRKVIPPPADAVKPDPEIVRKLRLNAYKFGILAIGAYCLTNGSVLICSQLLGEQATASFGLTVQIGNFLVSFASLWLIVKWPEIAMLRTQGRLHEMAVVFARRLALVMLTFIGIAAIVLLAGNRLIALMGKHTHLLETPYLALYMAYLAQNIFYVQFGMLAFTENVVPFFKISIFTGLGVIAGSVLMTSLFGLWGLLITPLIVESICSNWFTVRRGFQGQPLMSREFVLAAIRGHI